MLIRGTTITTTAADIGAGRGELGAGPGDPCAAVVSTPVLVGDLEGPREHDGHGLRLLHGAAQHGVAVQPPLRLVAADPAEDALVDGTVRVAEGDVLDRELPRQLRVTPSAPLHLAQSDAHRVDVDRHLGGEKE